MSKVLKVVGVVAGFVAAAAAIATGFGAIAIAGISLATLGAAASAVALGASLLAGRPKPPKSSPADRTRLFASINPREPRKIIYGNTAMATDIRDEEYTGADQEYFHRFLVVAAHKIGGISEIWFDEILAWTEAGGAQGDFAGFLDVDIILEGNAGNAINISPRMGATRIYTGLAYVHFRYKITGPNQETQSPFAQSVPTRITIKGDGMPVYDPRQDSTAGGSGAHRIDDQTTWGWADDIHRNPALQLLNYLIGWKINGLLSVGKGVPAARIDLASFIAAANLCDEPIALAAGGTEPRYRTGGIFSESDQMSLVLDQFKSSMNATLDDVDGKIRVYVLHNDLALPVADFSDDDILGDVDWRPNIRLTDHFNIIRGSHTDPSDAALYQSVAWPEIELPSVDGIDRIETVDFPLVESVGQCQRLANQRLQRMQYSGVFAASYQRTAWAVQKGDVIRQTFAPLGFVNKLFRVIDTGAQFDGTVPMLLREENSAIYAWDASEQATVIPAPPDSYDYTKNPLYAEMAKKIEAWAPWSGIEENRPRDIRALPDGSVWKFTGAIAATGSFPTLANANWTQISPPTNAPILSGVDLEEMREALAGAVFWQESAPSAAASYIGQKWVKPSTGEIYLRIGGGILLDGKVITLGGFRPSIYWTLQAAQPLAAALQSSSDAANNASTALADAIAANAALSDIANDDLLTPGEKPEVILKRDVILAEQAGITAEATAYAITTEKTAYTASITALTDYLATLTAPVIWSSLAGNTTIAGAAFRAKFADVYEARQALLNAIAAAAKSLADAAQAQADIGVAAAAAAQAAADTAQAAADDALADAAAAQGSANAANAALSDIANDDLLTPGEKPEVILKRDVILAEQAGITAEATAYAITTEKTAYTASITALTDYLATLTAPVIWSSLAGNTTIAGAAFRGSFADVYAARQALLNAIAAAAKSLADAAQAEADNAGAAAAAAHAAATAAQADADAALADAAAAQGSANAANAALTDIANDDLLTPGEKPEVILKRDVILAEQAGITAEATSHAITTEKTAYTASITALTDYLATLTAPVIWSSLAGNTTIAGAAFRGSFADVYAARQALLNAIAAAARARADIKGKTFIQASPPSAAISEIGDIWISADGTYHDRVGTSITLGGNVITLGGFRPSLVWTRALAQPAKTASVDKDGLLLSYEGGPYQVDNARQTWADVNGDGIPDDYADVTAAAQITIDPIAPFDIQANSAGETTSALPQSRTVKLRKGGDLITSGLSFSQNSVSAGLAITVGASSGVIDLTAAPVAGAILIDVVYAGVTYQAAILVNRTKAAAITGGGAGSTQFIDDEWTNISTTSFVQVTDSGAKVQSNASGELRYSASASYNGAGTAVIKAQYSLDGSTWSDFAAEESGLAATTGSEPSPGYVAIGAATKTGLSVSTDYYVRLIAKISAGGGSLSWFGAGFTIKQP